MCRLVFRSVCILKKHLPSFCPLLPPSSRSLDLELNIAQHLPQVDLHLGEQSNVHCGGGANGVEDHEPTEGIINLLTVSFFRFLLIFLFSDEPTECFYLLTLIFPVSK